ncbi:DNA-binding MarR family transcriptional regulator [Saccharopolyspora lacisalsi]|uniref:DNA-binding MarR family transcriptional regulator n=1 Tax=Halosaccharopolyspora lacisalsi TaxID=1000566 RepID=A0A839E638_9PSEU|nr:MarR family transcriptional regulator [Halosaccharopolyspora lacisalsi]MBA8826791.1 DNA-binding MarR family transcriptional regulator [Halosaccharopolyspora lacisalsi]
MEHTPSEHLLDEIELESARLVRNFELMRRRTDSYEELDRSEYLLLRTLDETGPADINTLAAVLGLDPSTAGRQVATMRKAGLIECEPATDDRRRSIITPTEQGRDEARSVRLHRHRNLDELFAEWSEDELRTLGTMVSRYNRAIRERFGDERRN